MWGAWWDGGTVVQWLEWYSSPVLRGLRTSMGGNGREKSEMASAEVEEGVRRACSHAHLEEGSAG